MTKRVLHLGLGIRVRRPLGVRGGVRGVCSGSLATEG